MSFTWVLITFSLALAGAVKGVFGMGLPTVSMGLLGLMMPPVQAAALLVIPTLLTNLWQLITGPSFLALVARFATMTITLVIGTIIGIGFLTSRSTWVSLALGSVLVVYGSIGLTIRHALIPARYEKWLSPIVGLLTGIVNGATGVSVIPLVPYLNSLALSRDVLIQAMGLMFTTATIALGACLAWTGHLQRTALGASAFALLPVFVGMFFGMIIRRKLHPDVFRKWFFVGLLALGGGMIIRAIV